MRPFALALLLIASVAPACAHETTAAPSMVILVRHAEKGPEPAADPLLAPAGEQRALALADALQDAGVGAIVTTQLQRTRSTAQPLANKLGVTPDVVTAGGSDAAVHGKAVADVVRTHGGKVVLVVGHSNTVPAIIHALGGPQLPDLCDAQYDRMFVLVPDGDAMRLVRSSYGAASGACE